MKSGGSVLLYFEKVLNKNKIVYLLDMRMHIIIVIFNAKTS